jgi:hypothetical protein
MFAGCGFGEGDMKPEIRWASEAQMKGALIRWTILLMPETLAEMLRPQNTDSGYLLRKKGRYAGTS